MGNRHAGVLAHVEGQAEAPLVQPLLSGHLGGDGEQPRQQRPVLIGDVQRRGDVLLGDHHHVDRGPRVDIADGEHQVVFVQLVDLHLALGHVAEQAVGH